MAIHTIDWQEAPPPSCRHGVVTIGNFDGVHRGHAALLEEARRQAARLGGSAVALTFDPHPVQLLRPAASPPLLTTITDRLRLLERQGADEVLVLQTSLPFLALSAEEFFRQVLLDRLGARALVEGHSFGFGRGREGNIQYLTELCRGAQLPLTVVPAQIVAGAPVSSSRIRAALQQGDVSEAALFLGRPYRIRGLVAAGERRGRGLGFPTANLTEVATVLPADGVYAGRACLGDQTRAAAVNIGANPTFGEQARKVEAHLLDFDGDLYGQHLEVEFLSRLRDTRPFASAEDLVAQLNHDIAATRRITEEAGRGA